MHAPVEQRLEAAVRSSLLVARRNLDLVAVLLPLLIGRCSRGKNCQPDNSSTCSSDTSNWVNGTDKGIGVELFGRMNDAMRGGRGEEGEDDDEEEEDFEPFGTTNTILKKCVGTCTNEVNDGPRTGVWMVGGVSEEEEEDFVAVVVVASAKDCESVGAVDGVLDGD